MHIIKIIKPNASAEYIPEGFGFTAHAHTMDINEAQRFDDRQRAIDYASRYFNPPAFWEGERKHAIAQREKTKTWAFVVEELTATGA